MSETIAIIGVSCTWLAWCFALLQLATAGRKLAVGAMLVLAGAGIAALATRDGSALGFEWLRGQRLRSDAYALGAIIPTASLAAGTWIADRRCALASSAPLLVAALACAASGLAALAIGRSGWYWEFVALVVAGVVLLVTGGVGAWRGGGSPNVRVVQGAAAAFGAFLAVGGVLLLLAWRSLV